MRVKLIGTIEWWDLYVRTYRSVTIECEGQIIWVELLNVTHAGHGHGNALYTIERDQSLRIDRLDLNNNA